ncbi:hypothetical protein ABEH28_13345 [Pseudomonas sp. Ps21-P2]|uniref:hypothetical protein n=1 Tax=Pseudomonas sp. Ps21-P2 TaxID=3080331 RepID=UPI003209DE6B
MSDLSERFQVEARSSSEFKRKLFELAYASGYIKKLKIEDPENKNYQVEVSELSPDVRFIFLKSKPGVSEMIMSIRKTKDLELNAVENPEIREIARKFNQINSNLAQITNLTDGYSFTHEGRTIDMSLYASEFFFAKLEVSEVVDKILSKREPVPVTAGPIFEAKKDFERHIDVAGALKDTVVVKVDPVTRDYLKSGNGGVKSTIRELVGNAKLVKYVAPVSDPFLVKALEIYKSLNTNIEAINLKIKHEGTYSERTKKILANDLNNRKKELLALLKTQQPTVVK